MSFRPNLQEQYFTADGRLTLAGLKLFQSMTDRLDAIAGVTAPTGGATQDAEARQAINDIISGAG